MCFSWLKIFYYIFPGVTESPIASGSNDHRDATPRVDFSSSNGKVEGSQADADMLSALGFELDPDISVYGDKISDYIVKILTPVLKNGMIPAARNELVKTVRSRRCRQTTSECFKQHN